MEKRPLGRTGLSIAPLVFGCNVFGWTIDEKTSFSLLDAFVDGGLDAIDTADVYSAWKPGNKGGESETIIGNWLAANPGKRQRITLFTKVGMDLGNTGTVNLAASYIERCVEDSLRRLKTDVIDLYFSHKPDPKIPYAETLSAHEKLLKSGKVRSIGASNLNAAQLGESLKVASEKGLPAYQVLQPEYNLYDRQGYDGALRDLCIKEDIGVVPYYSLAMGFLTGKYRSKADLGKSARGERAAKYLDARGERILAALDQIAEAKDAQQGEVAIGGVIQRKGITAPIASATNVEQVSSLIKAAALHLSAEDIATLDTASA